MGRSVSLRRAVAALAALSALYALGFAGPMARTAGDVASAVASDPGLLAWWAAAALGVLAGHAVRAARMRLLFAPAAETSLRDQYGAFCVGSLCNAVLPLRLGELVRADALAQATRTSFSYSLALAALERSADALALGALLAPFGMFSPPLALAASLTLAAVAVLWRSPGWFRSAASRAASLMEEGVATRTLFRLWTVEYGLRRALGRGALLRYLALTLLDWAAYAGSLALFLGRALGVGPQAAVPAALATFAALTSSAAPGALGGFSAQLASWGLSHPWAYIMAWCACVVPTALLGLAWAALGLRGVPLLRGRREAADGTVANKLSREADVSASQAAFLRDYYAGVPLAEQISREDMGGVASLGRYFTGGGSAAVTYLARRGGSSFVTKRVDVARSRPLREQYAWLARHRCGTIAGVGSEGEDGATYWMEVAFEPGSVDGFDWVHECTEDAARDFVGTCVSTLAARVWEAPGALVPVGRSEGEARVRRYLEAHVERCMGLAVSSLPSLADAMAPASLVVNGAERPNLPALLSELRSCGAALRDLADFRLSPSVHGDLIVDNVIWSRERSCPVMLDPVPCGNVLDGPVFDFGKLSQSLQIGYEFALRDTSEVALREDGSGRPRVVEFADRRSERYERLWEHVRDGLAPEWLSPAEQRTMLFVGATNYFRRMKHQAVQCPANALKFYALGVACLDEWMGLYR